MLSKIDLTQKEMHSNGGEARARSLQPHRRRPLSVLFVHLDADVMEACSQELEKAQFMVRSDFVLSVAQRADQLRVQPADVMVIDYPSPACKESQALQLIQQSALELPVIFLTNAMGPKFAAASTADGCFEYIEQAHLTQLPLVVRRLLNERKLRNELDEAKRALRHSQSLYRALADNPTYGVYRCDADGELLDVNLALLTMLGYTSKSELLSANRESEVISNLRNHSLRAGLIPETQRIEPVELEWKRKDGTKLNTRLSGREVYDDHGNLAGHEIIVVDVTEQRTLEGQLRHQASSDSLTGLANHGRLFEVLHAEICRSERTGREFSLLLLDLDGLKKINDQHGHLVGSRALCRLAQILGDCSRSVDTAARHGGDEFALVLPETGADAARLVGHRIRELLAKDGEAPAVSVSVGVAAYPTDATTIGTLLYGADRALYEMKENSTRTSDALRNVQQLPQDATGKSLPTAK